MTEPDHARLSAKGESRRLRRSAGIENSVEEKGAKSIRTSVAVAHFIFPFEPGIGVSGNRRQIASSPSYNLS